MRYGIPLVGDRVAPRCTFAQSVLIVALKKGVARAEGAVPLANPGLPELSKALSESQVDVLVCGGITWKERELLEEQAVDVVDNVAGSVAEVMDGLRRGVLVTGFGLATPSGSPDKERTFPDGAPVAFEEGEPEAPDEFPDCLACRDLRCLQGKPCGLLPSSVSSPRLEREVERMLEASLDVSSEKDRTLCRLSELIYFCLEMGYRRIGVAYCIDLQEPCEILVRVLRRFFRVYPVCCKIGGTSAFLNSSPDQREQKPTECIACNPIGQARVLNRIGTDLNVVVGVCMGADCVFVRFSEAPATTLFVKDRSLANNPIGAIYSDYYLKEAKKAAPHGVNWSSAVEAVEHPEVIHGR